MKQNPLEIYAQVILHSGCATPPKGEDEPRKHRWDECAIQKFFLKVAAKHQHKLKSNGLAIGFWIKEEDLKFIKEQKGDFLGLLDSLMEKMS
jgi:hypothetical protein